MYGVEALSALAYVASLRLAVSYLPSLSASVVSSLASDMRRSNRLNVEHLFDTEARAFAPFASEESLAITQLTCRPPILHADRPLALAVGDIRWIAAPAASSKPTSVAKRARIFCRYNRHLNTIQPHI